MDMRIQTESTTPGNFPTWDLYVDPQGIVPILTGEPEIAQNAAVASYLQVGTIPQLPTTGIPWMDFLQDSSNLNYVDQAIKNRLVELGIFTYGPEYSIINDELVATIKKVSA